MASVYSTGDVVRIGDRVSAGAQQTPEWVGEVVVDSRSFFAAFPESEWGYLRTGFMVRFGDRKLIHYPDSDPDLALLRRAG